MNLGELIEELGALPPDLVLTPGITNPHSYRGYYNELAFEPTDRMTAGEMHKIAESARNRTFEGWKGGEYFMSSNTTVWIANEGSTVNSQMMTGIGLCLTSER